MTLGLPPLVHFSAKPLGSICSAAQDKEPGPKPCGLWVSCEDGWGWKDWCESEQWGLDTLQHQSRVVLAPEARILHLGTPEDIDQFGTEFIEPPSWGGTHSMYLSWLRVAARYQGIVIAPYQYSRRLYPDCSWYYGWDCASGCVWDAEAIAEIVPVETVS